MKGGVMKYMKKNIASLGEFIDMAWILGQAEYFPTKTLESIYKDNIDRFPVDRSFVYALTKNYKYYKDYDSLSKDYNRDEIDDMSEGKAEIGFCPDKRNRLIEYKDESFLVCIFKGTLR